MYLVSFVLIFGYNPNALEMITITTIVTMAARMAPQPQPVETFQPC